MRFFWLVLLVPLLCQCGGGGEGASHKPVSRTGGVASFGGFGGFGGTSVGRSPAVINVSGWDPKETQRSGEVFSQHDVSAFRRNGAVGFIARSAKGPLLDDKFSDFIQSADRSGMLVGAYHFVTMDIDPAVQADCFVDRVRSEARSRGLSQRRILLVGDFDTASTPDRLVEFIERVEQRAGVTPMVYLENSSGLRTRLSQASPAQKAVIRRAPYWIALYGPGGTERSMGGELTPDELMSQYGIWDEWVMWQYGGVVWGGGRSNAKHYSTSSWSSPRYFGNMAMPAERSVFRGNVASLTEFWKRHGMEWW